MRAHRRPGRSLAYRERGDDQAGGGHGRGGARPAAPRDGGRGGRREPRPGLRGPGRGLAPGRSAPDFEDGFAAWLARESPRRVIWLAEAGGRLVGAMNLTVFERMPRPGRARARWGYLGNAFVLAAYRNRGIGGQLLDAVLDHAQEQGFARVVLSPTERAIPFYQRAGFGPAGEL